MITNVIHNKIEEENRNSLLLEHQNLLKIHEDKMQSTDRLILNVGGVKHELLLKTLDQVPNSRLGRLKNANTTQKVLQICDGFHENEYFFERNPDSFTNILNFYRTGKLHLKDNICVLSFQEDLKYWEIPDLNIEICCQQKYYQKKEEIMEEIRKEEKVLKLITEVDAFKTCFPSLRKKVWNLMENPQSSNIAYIVSIISIIFILISTIAFTLNTLPDFKHKKFLNSSNFTNQTNDLMHFKQILYENNEPYILTENPAFEIIEAICILWFTFEYFLRLWSSPHKKKFLKGYLNLIDIMAIVPYFASIFLSHQTYFNVEKFNYFRRIILVFRVLRVFRILKLARHSTSLQSLGFTLKKSQKELGVLSLFLFIGVVLFSSLMYYVENEQLESKFSSIPASFWWGLITITTVGYGDMCPETYLGKIVASFTCICGVLLIALPIPIIVNNFSNFYEDQMKQVKFQQRVKEREKVKLNNSNNNE